MIELDDKSMTNERQTKSIKLFTRVTPEMAQDLNNLMEVMEIFKVSKFIRKLLKKVINNAKQRQIIR